MSSTTTSPKAATKKSFTKPTNKPLAQALEEATTQHTYLDIYTRIYQIFAAGHIYLSQWQGLQLSDPVLQSLLKVMKYQEEVAQLKGLGIWVLIMLSTHADTHTQTVVVDSLCEPATVSELLKLLCTQSNHCYVWELLCVLVEKHKKLSYAQLLKPLEDVCGHLLSPMPINNSQEVFKFVLHAYIREPHTHSQTFALLSTLLDPAIMRRDVLGQYYVGTFSHIWLKALDVRPQVNRTNTDEDIFNAARVLEGLVYLHHTHDEELFQNNAIHAVIDLVFGEQQRDGIQLSVATRNALMDVIIAVAQNPTLVPHLRALISPAQLHAFTFMEVRQTPRGSVTLSLTLRQSFRLFACLYLQLLPSGINTPNLYKSNTSSGTSVDKYTQMRAYMQSHSAFTAYLSPVLLLCHEIYTAELQRITSLLSVSDASTPTDRDKDAIYSETQKRLAHIPELLGHINFVYRTLAYAGHFVTHPQAHTDTAIAPIVAPTVSTQTGASSARKQSFSGLPNAVFTSMLTQAQSYPKEPQSQTHQNKLLLESLCPHLHTLKHSLISVLSQLLSLSDMCSMSLAETQPQQVAECVAVCVDGLILRKLTNTLAHMTGYVDVCWKFKCVDEELVSHAQRVYMDLPESQAQSQAQEQTVTAQGQQAAITDDATDSIISTRSKSNSSTSSSSDAIAIAQLSTSPGTTYMHDMSVTVSAHAQRKYSLTEPSNILSSTHINPQTHRRNSSAESSPREVQTLPQVPSFALVQIRDKSPTQLQLEQKGMPSQLAGCVAAYIDTHVHKLLTTWSSLTVDKKFVHISLLALINVTVGIEILVDLINLKTLSEKIYGVFRDHTEYGLEQQCAQLLTSILIHLKNVQQKGYLVAALRQVSSARSDSSPRSDGSPRSVSGDGQPPQTQASQVPSETNNTLTQQFLMKQRFVSRGRSNSVTPQSNLTQTHTLAQQSQAQSQAASSSSSSGSSGSSPKTSPRTGSAKSSSSSSSAAQTQPHVQSVIEPTTLTYIKPLCDLCVSRLTNSVNRHNDSMLYLYVCVLIALCYHDVHARKYVCVHFIKIHNVFVSASSGHLRAEAAVCLLSLFLHCVDTHNNTTITHTPVAGGSSSSSSGSYTQTMSDVADREDCFTLLCVYALRVSVFAQSFVSGMCVCACIQHVGSNHPNIAKRLFSKIEVEHSLLELLKISHSCMQRDNNKTLTMLHPPRAHSGSSGPSTPTAARTQARTPSPSHTTTVTTSNRVVRYANTQIFPYPHLTYLSLRAICVCLRLLVTKCNWELTEFAFPVNSFSVCIPPHETGAAGHTPAMQQRKPRPLLCEQMIDLLMDTSTHVHPSFRLLCVSATVEAFTALRLNCRHSDTHSASETELFATLVNAMLQRGCVSLVPQLLKVLIHKRNIITVNVCMPRAHDKSLLNNSVSYSPREEEASSGSGAGPGDSPRFPIASKFPRLRNILNKPGRGTPEKKADKDKDKDSVDKALTGAASKGGMQAKGQGRSKTTPPLPETAHSNSNDANTLTHTDPTGRLRTVSVDSAYALMDPDDPLLNPTLELVTENAVEAMYAFFCLDTSHHHAHAGHNDTNTSNSTMQAVPMQTFATHTHLFAQTPIYYLLEYCMLCYPDNILIQHRGIEIFATFAENNINLYSLTIHASIVLMIAFETFQQSTEMYNAFAKLVCAILKSPQCSETVREKLVRYGIQDGLGRICGEGFSIEATVCALQSLQLLCVNDEDAVTVMEGDVGRTVVTHVLRAMEHFTTDHRVQVEGFKFLLCVVHTEEYQQKAHLPQTATILKKARKVLLTIMEQRSLASGYRYADVQQILKHDAFPRADGEKCVIC